MSEILASVIKNRKAQMRSASIAIVNATACGRSALGLLLPIKC